MLRLLDQTGAKMPLFLQPFRKYADFSGRARRAEYWSFMLLVAAPMIGLSFLAEWGSISAAVLYVLFSLVLSLPLLAVQVRRLHDVDATGWWSAILLFPFFGPVALLIFSCCDGTRGDNRFGPDPKGRPSPPSRPPQVATPGAGIVTS
jgi:uncharacterized membrane protein YhaH (DUF805 family)